MPISIIVPDDVAEKYAELVEDARRLLDMQLDPTTIMELLATPMYYIGPLAHIFGARSERQITVQRA